MRGSSKTSAVRRSDPTLRDRPNKDAFRPWGLAKWASLSLYAIFWVLLLVPLLRRWRRRAAWRWIRWNLALAGFVVFVAGMVVAKGWLAGAGAAVAVAALLLPPAADPDRERKLQARHEADYLLNGGQFSSGGPKAALSIPRGTPLYLLLRGREMLVVSARGPGDVQATIHLDEIREVRVAGECYIPIYVSEAKDPPVREDKVERTATTAMELLMESGETLRFEYSGAFSKHLAETAAHAIYSVRKLGGTDAVAGQSPEVFHIVGR